MEIDSLVKIVKAKRELSGLSAEVVTSAVLSYLSRKRIPLDALKEKDAKLVASGVRAELRRITGQFHRGETHVSTTERADVYPLLQKLLSSLSVKSVLDLGCGVNPLNLAKSGMKYYAYDINESELKEVRDYFGKNNIEGQAVMQDLRNGPDSFPDADICLMLKLLDSIETKGHKTAETLIKKVRTEYFLISFPTKTLSGAPMRHPQRGWIERLLTRLGMWFGSFSTKNEIFYLAGSALSLKEPALRLISEMQQ